MRCSGWVCLLLCTQTVEAQIYVSASGSDTNGDGSEMNPYYTINFASTRVQDAGGNIVLLGSGGVFSGFGNIGLTFGSTTLNISSTTDATIDCENDRGIKGWWLTTGSYVLTGLTFRRCDQALCTQEVSVFIVSCRFEDNFRTPALVGEPLMNGSAIEVNRGSVHIVDSLFLNNNAGPGYGGAIYLSDASVKVVRGIMRGNSACGGGFAALYRGNLEIVGTSANANSASGCDSSEMSTVSPHAAPAALSGGGGAVIYTDNGAVQVSQSYSQLSPSSLASSSNVQCSGNQGVVVEGQTLCSNGTYFPYTGGSPGKGGIGTGAAIGITSAVLVTAGVSGILVYSHFRRPRSGATTAQDAPNGSESEAPYTSADVAAAGPSRGVVESI